ncbi:hypothetical protein RDV64_01505 [Acuticoccus sp. MNP-M23]|uniref:hypothetical protein n=1 Tax=Acuticoccus sp. MNP-M23 TaxID=3072793 RepID=UPI0028164C83|nr:hypothetical protein [Acuticoccus sp. MNP-M23]WMS43108.1 hypothetical protein RDV64_01505 [Acuticoccus sp. MNP-M23]
MDYMECKALSEIAELNTQLALACFIAEMRAGKSIETSRSTWMACLLSASAWDQFFDAYDICMSECPDEWKNPGYAKAA